MRVGQLSLEFIIILGALITVLGTVTVPLYRDSFSDADRLTRLSQAREAANGLANTLNETLGMVGPKHNVTYSLPQGVSQVRIGEGVDGTDGAPPDGRSEVQIEMEWSGDNLIRVNTLLPSKFHENWSGYPMIDNDARSDEKSFCLLPSDSERHDIIVKYHRPDENHENFWIELREEAP